jgi:quinol monooxygenase YgiN
MLKVIAEDFIKPDRIGIVTPLYAELVEKTRQEPLCIAYDLFVDQKDAGHFVFIVPLINRHQRREGTFILMDAFAS